MIWSNCCIAFFYIYRKCDFVLPLEGF